MCSGAGSVIDGARAGCQQKRRISISQMQQEKRRAVFVGRRADGQNPETREKVRRARLSIFVLFEINFAVRFTDCSSFVGGLNVTTSVSHG